MNGRWKTVSFLAFIFCIPTLFAEPPKNIPAEMFNEFTLNGQIPVIDWYLDDSRASDHPLLYTKKKITKKIREAQEKKQAYYGITDEWLYDVLNKHSIRGKEVAIIGSVTPWYESVVIAFGGYPTTIEYNKIISEDSRLKVMIPDEWKAHPKKFDVILSISSIEHDGLGRYGDPLNPRGDLQFMAMAKEQMLKKSGVMILSMPVGADALVWNAHRIYGPIRLPMLLNGWKVVDSSGFSESLFNSRPGELVQPVFYLTPAGEASTAN